MEEPKKPKMYLSFGKRNMEYNIEFSETCLEEIEHICYYIDKELKAKKSSNKLRKKIHEKVQDLKRYPRMYPKIKMRNNTSREYRRIVIDNFVILYVIKKENTILISHMYYYRKNYLNGKI